jgi:hypothetical protein
MAMALRKKMCRDVQYCYRGPRQNRRPFGTSFPDAALCPNCLNEIWNLEDEKIAMIIPHVALQPFGGSVKQCGGGNRRCIGRLVSSRRGTLGITVAIITCFLQVNMLHQSDPQGAISLF